MKNRRGIMTEIWDLYNENRISINKTHLRGLPIAKGEYHIVVDIWVINTNGQILIDKRHSDKPLGGLWECTGGSVISGENSKMGAVRELEEELGLKVDLSELILIHSIKLNDRFVDTYILIKDIDINKLILQENEVTEVKFVSLKELDELWENKKLAIKERYRMYHNKLTLYTEELI
jgi:mutator protein MutT